MSIDRVTEYAKKTIEENKMGTNILTENILNGSQAFVSLKDKLGSKQYIFNFLILSDIFNSSLLFIYERKKRPAERPGVYYNR